jgi:hypothetical protein
MRNLLYKIYVNSISIVLKCLQTEDMLYYEELLSKGSLKHTVITCFEIH